MLLAMTFLIIIHYHTETVFASNNTSSTNGPLSKSSSGSNSADNAGPLNSLISNPVVISAIISAAISGAFGSFQMIKGKKLEAKLAREKARLEYEYNALKILYQNFEPILFNFSESCDSAALRIIDLADNAKGGNLAQWLTPKWREGRYLYESTYYLLAPMAVFKLLQKRLTLVDLKLDQHINLKYLIAKEIYYTFTQHRELAKIKHELKYEPKEEEPKESKHYYQGISPSTLELITDGLIEGNSVISLSRFLEKLGNIFSDYKQPDEKEAALLRFIKRFDGFHPNTRPIFWRILLSQQWLYQVFKKIRREHKLEISTFK
jgi:hypothetical protein